MPEETKPESAPAKNDHNDGDALTEDELREKNPLGYTITEPTQEEIDDATADEEAEKGHS